MNHKYYNSLGVIKSALRADIIHGTFTAHNASNSTSELGFNGTFGFVNATNSHVSRGPFLLFFRDTFLFAVFHLPKPFFLLNFVPSSAARVLPRPSLAMVSPAAPVVDDVFPGAPLLYLFLSLESAVLPEPSAAHHDNLLLLLLHREQSLELVLV